MSIDTQTETDGDNVTQEQWDVALQIIGMWETMSRAAQQKLFHYLSCELAPVNRMFAKVYLGDDEEDDDPEAAMAALRAQGLEVVIVDDDPTLCLEVHGVSELRPSEFLDWMHSIVEPFKGYVEEAGYANPPGEGVGRLTDH
jgi:hypothetical protein